MDLLISAATQRSGSTLIQRIFNARKKTLIWGENGGCLTEFYRIYKNALQRSEEHKDVRDSFFNDGHHPNQWMACMTPEAQSLKKTVIQTIKNFHHQLYVLEHEKKYDTIGYKEVRYGKDELQLFRECYPECPVLLVIRHPVDVWKSVSKRERHERYGSPEAFCRFWETRVKEYRDLATKDSKMHFIRFEDIVEETPEIIYFIKEMGGVTAEQIKSVLEVKLSSTSKKTPPREVSKINTLCEQVMMEVGYETVK